MWRNTIRVCSMVLVSCRQGGLVCAVVVFFRHVVRSHLPMRAHLVQFQFLGSLMNLFFTSNETFRDVREGNRCVSLPFHAL